MQSDDQEWCRLASYGFVSPAPPTTGTRLLILVGGYRCNGRVNTTRTVPRGSVITEIMNPSAISYRISQWVGLDNPPDRLLNSPHRRTYTGMRSQGGPRNLHGLPHDGLQTRTGECILGVPTNPKCTDSSPSPLVGRRNRRCRW